MALELNHPIRLYFDSDHDGYATRQTLSHPAVAADS
jgi:hypothetical protein